MVLDNARNGACIRPPLHRVFSMRVLVGIPIALACASVLQAQEPAAASIPCHTNPCALIVDWGVGKALSDMPPDRKYGAPADFDKSLRATLQSHGMTAATSAPDSKVSIRVQATYKTRVLCEDMPGTTPDRSCATIGEAIANFASSESGEKLPTSIRMTNRCGASGAVMSMKQFGKLVGDMIWYSLEGEQQKAAKPMGRC